MRFFGEMEDWKNSAMSWKVASGMSWDLVKFEGKHLERSAVTKDTSCTTVVETTDMCTELAS